VARCAQNTTTSTSPNAGQIRKVLFHIDHLPRGYGAPASRRHQAVVGRQDAGAPKCWTSRFGDRGKTVIMSATCGLSDRHVRQAKPGKGGKALNLKPFTVTQRVSNPARQRLATSRKRVLRGEGQPNHEA